MTINERMDVIAKEAVIIGAMMLEPTILAFVIERLDSEDFLDIRCRMIYDAIYELVAEGMDVDILSVAEMLKSVGQLENVGGPEFLCKLTCSKNVGI